MIPTIEDYLKGRVYITQDGEEDVHDSLSNVVDACKDLIGLHVQAALEAASKTIRPEYLAQGTDIVVAKKKILSAYPLNNIK